MFLLVLQLWFLWTCKLESHAHLLTCLVNMQFLVQKQLSWKSLVLLLLFQLIYQYYDDITLNIPNPFVSFNLSLIFSGIFPSVVIPSGMT